MNRNLGKKLEAILTWAIPSNQDFELLASPTGFDNCYVLRVITRAWEKLDKANRIKKVEDAIYPELTHEEQQLLFRTSVLTPTEWEEIKLHLVGDRSKRIGGRKGKLTTSAGT